MRVKFDDEFSRPSLLFSLYIPYVNLERNSPILGSFLCLQQPGLICCRFHKEFSAFELMTFFMYTLRLIDGVRKTSFS